MTAFDTDVLTLVLRGNPSMAARAAAIDRQEQVVPIVVAEEILRGRLNLIRQAEAGRTGATLDQAYRWFEADLRDLGAFRILPYTPAADALYRQWRAAKIRVGSQDLRIAAVCIDHGAALVTRNARDYTRVPGLGLDVWD